MDRTIISMTRNQVLFLVVVVAIAVVGWFVLREVSPLVPVPKNSTIVAYGDSLVQGVGATEGNDFVSVVSRKIGIPIINAGKSGDTTDSALTRLDQIVASDPGVVILLLGGNDYLRRISKEKTFQNLQQIVTTLQKNNTVVLLLGVRGGLLTDTYDGDFKDFAKKNNLPYVPNVLKDLLGNKKFMFDQIHPNDAGYKIIAERVALELKTIFRK